MKEKTIIIEDCWDCPFQYWRETGSGDVNYCSLSRATLSDGTKFPDIDPCGQTNCPFEQGSFLLKIRLKKEKERLK